MSELLRKFGVTEVHGDKYAGEWPPSLFRKARGSLHSQRAHASDIDLKVFRCSCRAKLNCWTCRCCAGS